MRCLCSFIWDMYHRGSVSGSSYTDGVVHEVPVLLYLGHVPQGLRLRQLLNRQGGA